MTGTWKSEILDSTLARVANIPARNLSMSYGRGKTTSVTFDVRQDWRFSASIKDAASHVRCYRDDVLQATQLIWGPIWSGDDSGNSKVDVTAVSAHQILARSILRADLVLTAVPAAQAIQTIIDDGNAVQWTGIDTSIYALPSTSAITVTLPRGKSRLDCITDIISSVQDLDWELVPQPGTTTLAALRVSILQGQDRPNVRLEYGVGKRDIQSYSLKSVPDELSSTIMVEGASSDTEAPLQTSVVSAPWSPWPLDSYDSLSDLDNTDLLQNTADVFAILRATPQVLLSFAMSQQTRYQPFVDYDIGDRINARIIDAGIQVDGSVRVEGFTIQPTLEGVERVTQIIVDASGDS